ncbi:polyamine aminopropyltransferase [Streptomyces natalensis]|uniref:Polyamine aminopropyltransferase n=1 Tax=Streptomyces natalensis ATCC 27448 TaxID=1240678 RepID=A0A0D7CU21_9ACTN|nr:polyamine aminopropyltransferase [Streptomyces natalensis]KIZ19566.1 spermidine synthase [Streptomyces natalensis ATCC 27448]
MIDPSEPAVPGALGPPETLEAARLPVPSGLGRLLVLAVVFVCAACGLVYELELVALATYLVGDSVTQASVVLSVMVFAMGIGALLAKRMRCRAAVGFGVVEALLALVGGSSAMALYSCFAWFGQSRSALVGFSLAIGVLIGAEVPLLMTLIQRIRRQDAGGAVADLFAADYVGALVGGLAFPFLLLPRLGQLTGALVTGAVNAVAGGALVLWLFRRDLSPRTRWLLLLVNVLVLALLATGTLLASPFERAARRAVYGPGVRVAVQTGVQEVVMTGGTGGGAGAGRGRKGSGGPLELYLDGRLRVSEVNEYRYHEALVHPAMAGGPHARVLVLGGGDGLAVREILRYRAVRSVTVVELDPGVLHLARTDPGLSRLNHHALRDPRVHTVTADAFDWLRQRRAAASGGRLPGSPRRGPPGGRGESAPYDVIVSDLPDPGITASTKLYSQEFYGLAARLLAPGGRLVVHAGAPTERPRSYWTVEATMRSVGLATVPYRVPGQPADFSGAPDRATGPEGSLPPGRCSAVPAPGGNTFWGFVLAARRPPRLDLAPDAPPLASVTRAGLRADERGAAADRIPFLRPSTLMHPRYQG